jgi:hypothetical protein
MYFYILLGHVCNLFQAVIAYGYTPNLWRKVKVIFIPKPGKLTYDEAKCFRPISLTSFLQKALEKLVDRHIREKAFMTRPLQQRQYAYQQGKSTELTLHDSTPTIEKSINNKEVALGAFLDIKGAFDNASFRAIEIALENRHVNRTILKWMVIMLASRSVVSNVSR